MKTLNKEVGNHGEYLAYNYLRELGYEILERNFKCKIGELDIIGRDGSYIVFIEVKTRFGNRYGTPSEAVTYSKQHKIHKTAEFYIMIKKLYNSNFRFDVIEVTLDQNNDNPNIRLIKNAFQI
jgi:putative endonuclease